jgi:hypothetical protein
MRKLPLLVAALIFAFGCGLAYSDSPSLLAPIEGDFHALMLDIGSTITPNLQSMALSGNSIGEASINTFTFQLLGVGLSTFDGIANILHDSSYPWQFVLPLSSLVSTAIGTTGTTKDIFDMSGNAFGIPSFQFALGIPVGAGFEVIGSGLWIPKEVVDWAVPAIGGMIGGTTATMLSGLDPELSVINAGLKVRKVFIKDSGWAPALSASLGFMYSDFLLGVKVPSLAGILGKTINIAGVGDLEANVSKMNIATKTFSYGLEFNLSKRLFILTPFARVAAWYQSSTYLSDVAMTATVTGTGTPLTQSISSKVEKAINDLSLYTTAGCDLNIFGVVLSPSLTLDLENPVIDIKSLTLSGFTLNGVMFNVGLRLSY